MTPIDVDEHTFQAEVIERSRSLPVVVDFWAEWCAPCRTLGPVLDAAAAARGDQVVLVKIDTDANPELAQRFDIRGIPAVKAFRDGVVADEFVGVLPPAAVERFFDRLVPTAADLLVTQGDEQALRRALELEPGRADAALALAQILIERGDADAALTVLEQVPGDFQAEGLAARLKLARDAPAALATTVQEAFAALDEGATERGLELLLGALETADDLRDEIRKVIVAELDKLGPADPLARETRRRLAAALY